MQTLSLGVSPCPNDTFIFGALLNGLIETGGLGIRPTMADVEELNRLAMAGRLDVVKISVAQYPRIAQDYALLRCGGALGYGCGPIVVGRSEWDFNQPGLEPLRPPTVAIPGAMTTAALLADLCGCFPGTRLVLRYDEIMPAVAAGNADLGVVIHEGRFTYEEFGLKRIFDLGAWWEEKKRLPIPLGAIAMRRNLAPLVDHMEELIRSSLSRAQQDPGTVWPFVLQHAQEMSDTVIRNHIKTFVNEFSRDIGQAESAVRELVQVAASAAGISMPHLPLFATLP